MVLMLNGIRIKNRLGGDRIDDHEAEGCCYI